MIIKKFTKSVKVWAVFVIFLTLIGSLIGVNLGGSSDALAVNNRLESEKSVQLAVESDTEKRNSDEGESSSEEVTATNSSDNMGNTTESSITNAGNTDTRSAVSASELNALTNDESSNKMTGDTCKNNLGSLGWAVCPILEKTSSAVDWLYDKIDDILLLDPIPAEDGSPIYEIWKYCLGVTNIVFIIFLLIVIYSQITGWGITNYGIKKTLPKLIVMAVLVNLSFLICSLAVDVSNVVGNGLRGVFEAVEQTALSNMSSGVAESATTNVSVSEIYATLSGGTSLAVGAAVIAFEYGAIWMLIPTVLGAIVSVATGLITIALRQAVVMLLVMIAPLAFVANIMPNTEGLFKKWKQLLTSMLVFYPMFSLLYGASSLAGFAILTSARDGFGLLLGVAVQIFPLIFSWKLMQMSGTFLGDINARLRGFADKPLAASRAWADSHRQQTSLNTIARGNTPTSHLLRFLDNRKNLREKNMENLRTIRKNEANVYTQRVISDGYDGSKAQGNSEYLKPNKYTKIAKDASTSNLMSETATMDTAHTLSNYMNYYVSKDVRDGIKKAEANKDQETADRIRRNDVEYQRHAKGGQMALEFGRAQMTKESDEEADYGFMVSNFLDASMGYDPQNVNTVEGKRKMEKYRHYILSSTGGLGEVGQARVLGKIIARAAAVESNQRRDIAIIAAKFPPDKRNFRNFLFNYYNDDDGYATDKEGNRIEKVRDYLRVNDPGKLVMWDQYDDNGPYFDWYDSNGKYVTRIYKKDKSAIKELMSNFDAPINDPINNLLAIHAGIKEQPDSDIPVLRNMGLDSFRTTVGRALLSAPFKEKNAAFSPMVAEMVKKGYIQNYAQEYLAYLDSLNKATKPGAWNMQDSDAIGMFADIMNPDKWDLLFPTELIRGFRNVNGEPICGFRCDENGEIVRDENGKPIKVDANEATREELMARIKEKYIIPAAKKITVMMSRQTQNTMDNQKAGTTEKWKELKDVFDTKWGDGKAVSVSPYEQNGDMRQITRDIREKLYTVDENGNKQTYTNRNRGGGGRGNNNVNGAHSRHVNHEAEVFEIYNRSLDADDFATTVSDYLMSYQETVWIASQLQDFIINEGYGATKEQLYDFVIEQLAYVNYD